ncbi:synapse-associated protein 1-like isoform X3 [Pomacea canaliculata]|uniref:synapse-associated protein 1-like isoform X3 n=1 Tax=Pomacea canaliculata TaxID=400727 RepID=UPI000D73AA21|nr:synapse-associated protein 1-like isoform X3 [Pomacea canaliculata]
MFSSVTNWLGVNIKGKEGATSEEDKENVAQPNKEQHSESRDSISSTSVETSTSSKSLPESESEENKSTSEEESNPDISALHALEDVSLKAFNTAKEFGNILFNFGKAAGKTVAETAKQLKTTVEEKTILGDFSKEQAKFVAEKNESKRLEDAVPPWVGYNEEEAMKSQILALSTDKRNFLRNPPSGVKFQFDFSNMYPIALATLQEDPNLQKMRFDLVPKKVPEETFWRNYFYRVSLIKQSMQLTTLAQQAEDSSSSSWSSSVSIEQKDTEHNVNQEGLNESPVPGAEAGKEEEVHESPANDEFVSDTFNGQHLCEEDVRREMEQLGVKDDKKEGELIDDVIDAEWEKELMNELLELKN